jgi:hypothetical protein
MTAGCFKTKWNVNQLRSLHMQDGAVHYLLYSVIVRGNVFVGDYKHVCNLKSEDMKCTEN